MMRFVLTFSIMHAIEEVRNYEKLHTSETFLKIAGGRTLTPCSSDSIPLVTSYRNHQEFGIFKSLGTIALLNTLLGGGCKLITTAVLTKNTADRTDLRCTIRVISTRACWLSRLTIHRMENFPLPYKILGRCILPSPQDLHPFGLRCSTRLGRKQ